MTEMDDITAKYLKLAAHSLKQAKESIMLLGNIWQTVSPLLRVEGKRLLPANPVPEAIRSVGGWKKSIPNRPVIPLSKLGEWVYTVETLCIASETARGKRLIGEVLLLSLYCGFRNQECRQLKWENIEMGQGIITIIAADAKNNHKHLVPLIQHGNF